jgi:hypothetical protein
MHNRLSWLFFLLPVFLIFTASAGAQSAASARLISIQTEAFPRITAFFVFHDDQGKFVHGLAPSDLTVLEDGSSLPAAELSALRLGVQFVAALNPGPTFAVRDSKGISRFDQLAGSLQSWAKSREGSTIDDLSLLAVGGTELTHVPSPTDWLSSLESYKPDARSLQPNLDSLTRAVDVVSDTPPRPGMQRVLLYVTAPLEGDISLSVQNLIARAKEKGVIVYIWLVTSPDYVSSPSIDQLTELANQSGGQFFSFTGTEAIPELESYLEPLRDLYRLTYDSKITSGGSHSLVVEVSHNNEQIQAPAQSFEFNLKPPDPAFLSPQLLIIRKTPKQISSTNLWEKPDAVSLAPKQQILQILIDFPDGHARPLVSSTLYVDGIPAVRNTKAPFDRFSWDLSKYTNSGQHRLKIEVVDSMGLTGSSIETLFDVKVELPSAAPLAFLAGHIPLLGGLAALVLSSIVCLALILSGRIRPYAFSIPGRMRQRVRRQQKPASQATRPAADRAPDHYLPDWVNRLHWPQRRLAPKAPAYLTRLTKPGPAADTAVPVPVTAEEVTFGSDPKQASIALNDLSVDPLHARLIRKEDGSFWLYDEGSVAGTWINYTPISRDGAAVEHGDLIHVGRIGFRFTHRDLRFQRKPIITLEELPK